MLSSILKISTTICSFCICLKSGSHYVIIAMLLTIVSDYILLFTKFYIFGILIFFIVHVFYIYYQLKEKQSQRLLFSIVPLALFSVSLIYVSIFIIDILIAFQSFKNKASKKNTYFLAGLLLFALCDISIAIYFITANRIFSVLIWFFYAPSQLLIALSSSLKN